MFCKTYRCNMTEAACAIRHTNAIAGGKGHPTHGYKAGSHDTACRTCRQGAQVAKTIDMALVKSYQRDMRKARRRSEWVN